MLYIEGLPRWDFRFLKNAMRRDNGLGGPDRQGARHRPGSRVAAPARAAARRRPCRARSKHLAEYHTVILGDVSPELLDAGLRRPARQGGAREGRRPDRRGRAAVDAARVSTTRCKTCCRCGCDRQAAGIDARGIQPFRLELTPGGAIHEAMRFYDDPGRNQNAWAHLPPLLLVRGGRATGAGGDGPGLEPDVRTATASCR